MAKIFSVNPFKDFALQIFKQGYDITPIKPNTKRPYLEGWQHKKLDEEKIVSMAANGKAGDSIGIKTKYNPTIDVDVYDEDVVRDIQNAIMHITKGSLTRIGQAPKISYVFRTDTPFRKISGTQYRSPDGKTHRIEILGDGQQTVVSGMHPDTKQPFKFIGNNLLQVHSNDLPVLTIDQAHEVLDIFSKLVPDDWEVINGVEAQQIEDSDELERYKPRVTDYTDDDVINVINQIDPDLDRNLWLKVGFALWHQYELDLDKGFEIWDAWSAQGAKYNPKEMKRKWKGFDWRSARSVVTFASVLHMVEETAKEDTDGDLYTQDGAAVKRIDQYMRQFVFYSPNGRIIDLESDVKEQLTYNGLSPTTIANKYPDDADVVKGSKRIPTINIWMKNPDKLVVEGAMMGVGEPQIFYRDGYHRVNTYVPPDFPYTEDESELKVFIDHINYLIVNEDDRQLLWGWMAHLVQHPEERCTYAPLIITTSQGTGKSWLGRVLSEIVGMSNASKARIAEMCGEGSSGQFNEYLESVLCIVEETVADGKGVYTVSAKMRDTLTDTRLTINKKFGTKRVQQISTSFLMFSNHINALHIPAEDRRIWVIQGAAKPQDYSYYKKLFAFSANSKCLMQLYSYLKRVDIEATGFEAGGYAPRTALRQRMIESTSSPEDLAMSAIDNMPFAVFTSKQLAVYHELQTGDELNTQLVGMLLKRSSAVEAVKKRVKFKGAMCTVWVKVGNKEGIKSTNSTNHRYLKQLKITQDFLDTEEIGVDPEDML